MNWVEIKVTTTTEAIEAVSNIFYEAGVAGVVIEDPKIYLRSDDSGLWDYIEVPKDIDFEVAQVTGYLVEDSSLAERTRVIKERIKKLPGYGLDIGKGEIVLTTISQSDWEKRKFTMLTILAKPGDYPPGSLCSKPNELMKWIRMAFAQYLRLQCCAGTMERLRKTLQ